MKKFLFCMISLVVLLFVGFTTYYIIRNDESVAYTVSNNDTIYLNVGESIQSPIIHKNRASGSEVAVTLSGTNVIYDKDAETFTAQSAGSVTVTCIPSNSKFEAIAFTMQVGDGTINYPFYIRNEEDLSRIGQEQYTYSANYEVVSDIVLTKDFTPIGSENSAFLGSIFGGEKMFTISNLNISGNMSAAGFFANIGSSAKVERLTFDNVHIEGSFDYVGVIAGKNAGLIGQCVVKNASVTNNSISGYTGSIAGLNRTTGANAQISLCTAKASLTGRNYVGGMVGRNEGGIVHNSICTIDATLDDEDSNFGGLVGFNTFSQVEFGQTSQYFNARLVNDITILNNLGEKGSYYNICAHTECVDGQPTTFSYFDMVLSCSQDAIKPVGENIHDKEISSESEKSINYYKNISAQDLGSTDVFEQVPESTWDFKNFWSVDDGMLHIDYALCAGSYQDLPPLASLKGQLSSPEQVKSVLEYMQLYPNANLQFEFSEDIYLDLKGQTIKPIGNSSNKFSGKLVSKDDAVLTIANFVIEETEDEYAGLFGVISGPETELKGITVSEAQISGKSVGGIVGLNDGANISDCKVYSLTLNATSACGGFVGVNNGSLIGIDSEIESANVVRISFKDVAGEFAVGGAVGVNNNYLSSICVNDCEMAFMGDVDQSVYLGGVAGKQNRGLIEYCNSNNINVTSSDNASSYFYAGGIVGYLSGGKVYMDYVGSMSLPLSMTNDKTNAGGLCGFCAAQTVVSNCAVYGATIQSRLSGGLAAVLHGSIDQCAVVEGVKIYGYAAGGLVGDCFGNLQNSYSIATLTGSSIEAGFVAYLEEKAVVKFNYNFCQYDGEGKAYCETSTSFRSSKGGWQVLNNVVVGELVPRGGLLGMLGETATNECYQKGYRVKSEINQPVYQELMVPVIGEDGQVQRDEEGNPIYEVAKDAYGNVMYEPKKAHKKTDVQMTDENGKPMTDEDGDPIYEDELDENGNPIYIQKIDENGQPMYDVLGNPVYLEATDKNGNILYEEKKDSSGRIIYEIYQEATHPPKMVPKLDENGNQVIGSDGNVVYVEEVDEEGNIVYDEDEVIYVDAKDASGAPIKVITGWSEEIKDAKKVYIQNNNYAKGTFIIINQDIATGSQQYGEFKELAKFNANIWDFEREIVNNGRVYLTLKNLPGRN